MHEKRQVNMCFRSVTEAFKNIDIGFIIGAYFGTYIMRNIILKLWQKN